MNQEFLEVFNRNLVTGGENKLVFKCNFIIENHDSRFMIVDFGPQKFTKNFISMIILNNL